MADINPLNSMNSQPLQGKEAKTSGTKLPPRLANLFNADGKPTEKAIANQQTLNSAIFGGGSLRSKGAGSIFQKPKQA